MAQSDSFEARTGGDGGAAGGAERAAGPGPNLVAMAGPVAEGMIALQAAHSAGLALLSAQQDRQQWAIAAGAAACMTCATLLASAPARESGSEPAQSPAAPPPAQPTALPEAAEPAHGHAAVTPAAAAGAGAQAIVAQAAAFAVEDAAVALRNAAMVANTAAGASIARFLDTGDARYLEGADRAQAMVRAAIADFEAIGTAAARILNRAGPA